MKIVKVGVLFAGVLLFQAALCFCGDIIYEYDSCDRIKSATYTASNSIVTFSHDAAHNIIETKSLVDSDQDGIPDYWEMLNFGSLTNCNAVSDYDHDGLIDYEEFLNGSDPRDSSSSFMTGYLAGTTNTGCFIVQWLSQTNRSYAVQYSTNLLTGFSMLATNIPGTPPVNEYRHDTLVPRGFYRIKIEGGAE